MKPGLGGQGRGGEGMELVTMQERYHLFDMEETLGQVK